MGNSTGVVSGRIHRESDGGGGGDGGGGDGGGGDLSEASW